MSTPRRRGAFDGSAANAADAALAGIAGAVDAMRAGRFVQIVGADGASTTALAVETATDAAIGLLRSPGAAPPLLLLTHARARTLKIRCYTPDAVAIPLAEPFSAEQLRAIADPTRDLAEPLKGPFESLRAVLPEAHSASLKLAGLAGLLPATLVGTGGPPVEGTPGVPAAAIRDYDSLVVRSLRLVTRAPVPLAGAERSEIVAFRAGDGEPEQLAIVIGDPPAGRPVLTRLHSECFTGDLLGSLKCDCGAQLRGAIAIIAQAGGGVLLYLAQEGRGIGLINKLRAYRLQDQGFDTLEANARLGFGEDERLYGIAARMLDLLGYHSVRLMTNNPHKIEALRAAGIEVTERVPHAFPANPHNLAYLRTKTEKSGHLL